MDAKEYYEQFDTYDITSNPDPDYNLSFYQNIFRLMESYHQAKSKEEAEERYEKAKAMFNTEPNYDRCIRIASGKEES